MDTTQPEMQFLSSLQKPQTSLKSVHESPPSITISGLDSIRISDTAPTTRFNSTQKTGFEHKRTLFTYISTLTKRKPVKLAAQFALVIACTVLLSITHQLLEFWPSETVWIVSGSLLAFEGIYPLN
jgi:hypothetical protein